MGNLPSIQYEHTYFHTGPSKVKTGQIVLRTGQIVLSTGEIDLGLNQLVVILLLPV